MQCFFFSFLLFLVGLLHFYLCQLMVCFLSQTIPLQFLPSVVASVLLPVCTGMLQRPLGLGHEWCLSYVGAALWYGASNSSTSDMHPWCIRQQADYIVLHHQSCTWTADVIWRLSEGLLKKEKQEKSRTTFGWETWTTEQHGRNPSNTTVENNTGNITSC